MSKCHVTTSQLEDVCESCMSRKLTFGKRMQKFCRFCCANLLGTLGMLIPGMQALCWKVEDESAPKFVIHVVFSTHAKHPAPYPVVVFFELIQMFGAHNPPPKKGES